MASYYYLISSLPSLRSDSKAPITYEEFLAQCKSSVSKSMYDNLANLNVSTADKEGEKVSGPAIVRQWASFYEKLSRELCNRRLQNMGQSMKFEPCADSEIVQLVNKVMSAGDPLAAENTLIAGQYALIDGLCGMHFFDDYVLVGYALKLKLLERRNLFSQEKGKAEFGRLFDNIQNMINSI